MVSIINDLTATTSYRGNIKSMIRQPLNPSVSLYLDLARISAAVTVLLHHVFQPPYYDHTIHFPGRSAVIIFFVISGFVIAYATDGQRNWQPYAVARMARVYSVAIPALALTGLLVFTADLMGLNSTLETYNQPVLRLLISTVFINQFWNLTVGVLSNGPYWSLCYEVWYYALFGAWWFTRGRSRWILAFMIALIVGPRIMLLLPIWLLGVALYFTMKTRAAIGGAINFSLFIGTTAMLLFTLFVANPADALSRLVADALHDGYWYVGPLRWFIGGDSNFPSDYFIGLLFAATIWFSGSALSADTILKTPSRVIRWLSSYTFSLYLYHAPLLVFFHLVLKESLPLPWMGWALLLLILPCVWVLGGLTEHRKAPYTALFRRLFNWQVPQRA